MRSFSTFVAILAITDSFALATLFPFYGQDRVLLKPRQDGDSQSATSKRTSFDLSLTLEQGNTATTRSSSTASVTGGSSNTNTPSNGTSSNSKNTYASTQTFDARLPAGGVQMITPAPTAQASYYKIKDHVTFAWNYTSLSITPSAVDILASCSLNSQTYTLALNQSITGPSQAFVWDTEPSQSSLVTSEYTLIIHDSSKDVSAIAQAGYLGTFSNFRFGMYLPQNYTPLAEWQCSTCSSAISDIEKQTLRVVLSTAVLCVLGFGWFGGVAGLW